MRNRERVMRCTKLMWIIYHLKKYSWSSETHQFVDAFEFLRIHSHTDDERNAINSSLFGVLFFSVCRFHSILLDSIENAILVT